LALFVPANDPGRLRRDVDVLVAMELETGPLKGGMALVPPSSSHEASGPDEPKAVEDAETRGLSRFFPLGLESNIEREEIPFE
jgi:hypothetical protein